VTDNQTDTSWASAKVLDLMQRQIDDNKASTQRQIDDNKASGEATVLALVKSLDERSLSAKEAVAAALAGAEKVAEALRVTQEKALVKEGQAADKRHDSLVEKIDLQAERAEAQIKALASKLDQSAGRWVYIVPSTMLVTGILVTLVEKVLG
jgi:hypothetical protein